VVSKLFIIGLLSFSILGSPAKKKYPEKYYRKIASTFEKNKGEEIFAKVMACKNIEKTQGYFLKVQDCVKKHTAPYVGQSELIHIIAWILRMENPSTPDKCDIETITNYPSVSEDPNNDIVLCVDFSEGNRPKRALIFFDQKGSHLYFKGARY